MMLAVLHNKIFTALKKYWSRAPDPGCTKTFSAENLFAQLRCAEEWV